MMRTAMRSGTSSYRTPSNGFTDYHFDALRLDAVHAILDHSALNFLEELAGTRYTGKGPSESAASTYRGKRPQRTRVIRPPNLVATVSTRSGTTTFIIRFTRCSQPNGKGYYVDFGDFQHMAQAFSEGFVYSGRYSVTAAAGTAIPRAASLPPSLSCSRKTTIRSATG